MDIMQNLMAYQAIFLDNPTWFLSLVALFGLFVGSFINVVAIRLPMMMEESDRDECLAYLEEKEVDAKIPMANGGLPTTLFGRSYCPTCGHKIKSWENIPVLSYLFLRGKCASCKSPISKKYAIVEVLTAVLSVAVAYFNGPTAICLIGLVFTWMLIAAVLIDLDHMVLPDVITLPLTWFIILVSLCGVDRLNTNSVLVGAMLGYMVLWTIFWVFKLLTGREGMGYGDFKLLAAITALVGAINLPYVLLLSSVIGLFVAILMKREHQGSRAIPFGPPLAIAGWLIFMHQSGMTLPLIP